MGKYISNNISKYLSTKFSPNVLDHAKKSARDARQTTTKRVI